MQGWMCPNCGKAHAPQVLTCPEPVAARQVPPRPVAPLGAPVADSFDPRLGYGMRSDTDGVIVAHDLGPMPGSPGLLYPNQTRT